MYIWRPALTDNKLLSDKALDTSRGPGHKGIFGSLSFKQARAAVIVAFVLGVIFSALQIYFDLNSEKQRVDSKFTQLLRTVEDASVQAAYGLDIQQTENIVMGLFQYEPIVRAEITDSFGDQMAVVMRPVSYGKLKTISEFLFGPTKIFSLQLRVTEMDIDAGKIEIWVDTYVIAETFFTRSGLILLFGIVRNLFLATILAVLFHKMLTRPIHNVAAAIKRHERDIPIPINHQSDELGELVNAHNVLFEQKLLSEEALRESEDSFRDFARSSADWFWAMDENLRYSYLSDRFENQTGVPVTNRIGTHRWDHIHPSDAGDKWAEHRATVEAHKPFKNFEYTSNATAPNTPPLHLQVSGVPIFDKGGNFVGYRGSATDISERKNLEDQLRRSQRMEAMGQLTGGVAHDFNNLLNIMLGNTELLELEFRDNETAIHHFDSIKSAVNRGSSLTSRLLAFSRQQVLSPVAANITILINSLHELLHRTLGETIDMKVAHSKELWLANIDPHQFENALLNLAINAKDSMKSGGTLIIETSNSSLNSFFTEAQPELKPGDYVTVAVTDSGCGMPQDVIEKAFEPFFTTKDVGEGSGLGLSMVYGFVKQSDGHVSIYSEIDEGTTVKLYLPRRIDGSVEQQEPMHKQEPARGTERILVIEDDVNLREIPVMILRNKGYDVVEAGEGKEALNILNEGKLFDLLFSDVVLPGGMNGVEVADHAVRLQPSIKILYTTGYAENAVIENGRLDPGANLINKPYNSSELLKKVRSILDDNEH